MNSLNDWEKARREEELNQELKRQNNLLEQQRWEQQFSNQKQQAALDEQNRLAREQKETLKERNELERQRQWDEESRHQREIELRIEQQYKDNIFDLKKLWAKAESEDERGRIQILLAEAETEYDEYLLEKERELERKRLAAEQFQLKQQEEIEQNELLERRRQKISRIKWFFGIAISLLLLAIIGTFLIGMSKSKSSYTHNSNNHLTQPTTSETSTSSTTKSSPSTSKSQDKQTSTTSPTTRPQATRVYIGNFIGRKSIDVVAELKEKKVPENLIKIVEEESSETEAGLVMKQSLSEGTTYDLSKATEITLTVAKKVTSVPMPSYIGSSLEFTKNNLIQIVGVKEANIEVVEVSTAPEGTAEETVVSQSPKPGEGVDLNTTRIKISIYKPKTTTTTTTERPEKIKYKKEVQDFSKTMRPVVAKYGVTDEKLDELVNKWVEKGKYSGYPEEFNEESKKVFIETVIDSTAYNFILNSLDKAIDIVQKANYFDSTHKEKWLSEMKEYRVNYKEDNKENYPYHTRAYSRERYYQEDRNNLLNNYPNVLEKTIQYVKENEVKYQTEKNFIYEIENVFGYAEMQEEKEINQDSSLSEQQKKQLLEKIDDILEVKYTGFDNDRISFETINDIIIEIRQVHTNDNGNEYEEPFSKEKVEQYIFKIEKEKEDSKVKELISKAKVQFEEFSNTQKKQLLEEGMSAKDINNIFSAAFNEASKSARYYFRINRQREINSLINNAKNNVTYKINSLKGKGEVSKSLVSYVNSKQKELEAYGISDSKKEEIITDIVDGIDFYELRYYNFNYVVEKLVKDYNL